VIEQHEVGCRNMMFLAVLEDKIAARHLTDAVEAGRARWRRFIDFADERRREDFH